MEPVAVPLVGFRFWTRHSAGFIGPIIHKQWKLWPEDGRVSSSIESLDHPMAHKKMGIHAYYKPVGGFNTALPRIAGAIVGWGWVCEHESGFRCQHAEVIGFLEATSDPLLNEYAERYNVPVFDRPGLVEEGKKWGEVRCKLDELGGFVMTDYGVTKNTKYA